MRKIGLLVYPDFTAMSFATLTVFEMANLKLGSPYYEISLISENGGLVRCSMGIDVNTQMSGQTEYDTIIVAGADRLIRYDPDLIQDIVRASQSTRRIAAVCTSTFALAEAGLLNGKRATTHWFYAAEFRRQYPDVLTEEDRIYVTDGPLWSCAGMSAGLDMALAMVEQDLGPELPKGVARIMVMYSRRSGGQLQFSTLLELDPTSDRIQNALVYARNNLHLPLTVDELAKISNLSTRQFSRAFRTETGQSPAKAIERMRVEVARQLLEGGRLPIEQIAKDTGFGDRERMRKAFIDLLGQPPQALRRSTKNAR